MRLKVCDGNTLPESPVLSPEDVVDGALCLIGTPTSNDGEKWYVECTSLLPCQRYRPE